MTETKIEVRYPDLDPMGIVHHAVYPIWYEIARMQLLADCGLPWTRQHELSIDPVMVNLSLDYTAPVHYPATVTIKSRVILAEPKKLKILYECYDGDKLVNRASTLHIWCRNMKSIPLNEVDPLVFGNIQALCE